VAGHKAGGKGAERLDSHVGFPAEAAAQVGHHDLNGPQGEAEHLSQHPPDDKRPLGAGPDPEALPGLPLADAAVRLKLGVAYKGYRELALQNPVRILEPFPGFP